MRTMYSANSVQSRLAKEEQGLSGPVHYIRRRRDAPVPDADAKDAYYCRGKELLREGSGYLYLP
jgi:hypothetical protein